MSSLEECQNKQQIKIIPLGKHRPQAQHSQPLSPYTHNIPLTSVPTPIIRSYIPNQNLPPVKMISQFIGRPVNIQIPTSQLSAIEMQIRELRTRCQELEKYAKERLGENGPRSRDVQHTFQEIVKSTKVIQEHFGNVIEGAKGAVGTGQQVKSRDNTNTQDGFGLTKSSSCQWKCANIVCERANESGNTKVSKLQIKAQQQCTQVIQNLQQKSNKIQWLEARNNELFSSLSKTQGELQRVVKQNQELRKTIQLWTSGGSFLRK